MVGIEADSGKRVLNVSYGTADRQRFGLGIHRASLFDVVLGAAQDAGAKIIPGARISATTNEGGKRRLVLASGEASRPFDLVIDASGTGSPLSPLKAKPLPYGALWGVVDTPADNNLPLDYLSQCYRRSSAMAGVLPIGFLPGEKIAKTATFWSLPVAGFDTWRAAPIEEWKAHATGLWPEFAPFVRQINHHSDLTMAQYSHGNLRSPVGERLVFIGDAAHRASPQLGQGANMALLDAYVLADALRRLDIDAALAEYARIRRWHVRVYQAISWAFTPMYQSDSRILPFLRDWLLAPASGVWPTPGLLAKLVCGDLVSSGPLIDKAMRDYLENSPVSDRFTS
ncbi:MAG: FAD-dependent monooxygenase [Rhodobacteraceae bacterium]|nr:FAD-dependent monooxygenase [Paracoccaceae bacterium]